MIETEVKKKEAKDETCNECIVEIESEKHDISRNEASKAGKEKPMFRKLMSKTEGSKCFTCKFFHPKERTLIFAFRYSVSVLVAGLFMLCSSPGDPIIPEPLWILITAAVVGFFPNDTGGSFEKSFQRILGTVAGCIVGLIIGFISSVTGKFQPYFMGIALFLSFFCFSICFLEYPKTWQKFPYSSLLFVVTCGMVLLSFLDDSGWIVGVYRSVNIIIGCVIVMIVNVLVFPQPSSLVFRERVAKEIVMVGNLYKCIYEATAGVCSEENPKYLHPLVKLVKGTDDSIVDEIFSTEETAERSLKSLEVSIKFLGYSPNRIYSFCKHGQKSHLLRLDSFHCIGTLTRIRKLLAAMQILSTIVRYHPEHITVFNEEDGRVLSELENVSDAIISLCQVTGEMFATDNCDSKGDYLVAQLRSKLQLLETISAKLYEKQQPHPGSDSISRDMEFRAKHLEDSAIMFVGFRTVSVMYLSTVQHVILRMLRLHQCIKAHVSSIKTE